MTDKIHFRKDDKPFCRGGFSWSPLVEDKEKVTCKRCIKLLRNDEKIKK